MYYYICILSHNFFTCDLSAYTNGQYNLTKNIIKYVGQISNNKKIIFYLVTGEYYVTSIKCRAGCNL